MPNYSSNRLAINGPNSELDKLAIAVADQSSDDPDRRFSYAKIKPVAEGEDEGEAWGSTTVYCLNVERSDCELVFEWESSWDPPLAVVDALAGQWRELCFDFVYCEPCTGRYGARYLADGAYEWSQDESLCWDGTDDEMREFLEGYWPALAEKWWAGEDEDDWDGDDWEEAA